jgi:predicted metalloprotease with PDZ domain
LSALFREGFTEYAANLAMVGSAVWDESAFRAKLAKHVDNYGRLATPLDAPGDHKGPPLYSGGALVAFCWDTKIREATHGERGFADVLRALWRRTGGGTKAFVWSDIEASLQSVAAGDWDGFHSKYIHGDESLPLKEAFASVGLRLAKSPEGATVVEINATSSKDARIRWEALR